MVGLTGCQIGDPAALKDLECVFANIVAAILFLAGIVLFVMLIVGGFKYLTSGGDPKAVEAAKGTITSAIAGLIIIILAYVILLIIAKITGVDVTQFKVVQ
jgi:heme/copper-type cytochrome/quinol oxidase subunit 2